MPDEQTVIAAISLAERILRAVTSRRQDWSAIEQLSDALAALARRAARVPGDADADGAEVADSADNADNAAGGRD